MCKLYVHCLILIIVLIACNASIKNIPSNKITKVILRADVPVYDEENKVIKHYPDSSLIYFYKDLNVLQYSSIEYQIGEKDTGGDTIQLFIKSENYNWKYFMYKKNYSMGIFFDSVGNNMKILKTDSLLKKVATQISFSENFLQYWKPFKKEEKNDTLSNIFIAATPDEYGVIDTLYFLSSKKYNDVRHSINTKIDSLFGAKLFNYRMITPSFFDSKSKLTIPRREVFVEMQKAPVTESESRFIEGLINKSKEKIDSLMN